MKKLFFILLMIALVTAVLAACMQQTDTDPTVIAQTAIEPENTVPNYPAGQINENSSELPGNDASDSGEHSEASTGSDYETIMADTKMSPADMLVYIRENGEKLSAGQTANLVLRLEQLQTDGLTAMTERYFDADQSELLTDKTYDFETGEINIDSIKNESLREVLADARRNGYRTETAEGSFFPVIDYSIYENFSSMLPEDLSSYFSLMAVESGNKPASDGGLVIGWDEVINRAISQEQFILKYGQSQKLNEVKELYGKYVNFIFDGSSLPNAEHFTYDTKTLEPRLKESLLKAAAKNGNSPLEKTISEYLKVLKKNNYRLTAEVKQFRENAAAALSGRQAEAASASMLPG